MKVIKLSICIVFFSLVSTDASENPYFEPLSTGGGKFVIADHVGVDAVLFHYTVDDGARKTAISRLTDGGVWEYTDTSLRPTRELKYLSETFFRTGSVRSDMFVWHPASMVLPPRRMRGLVMFRDDFRHNLNTDQWLIAVTGTDDYQKQFQVYTNEKQNVYTKNGFLYLRPTLTVDSEHFTEDDLYHGVMDVQKTWGVCTESGNNGCYKDSKDGLLPPTLSGRVQSKPTIKYGTVTVRAKIPRGDWLWPAIWMMPKDQSYGYWPMSGEIDLMEATCNEVMHWGPNGKNVGVQRILSTFHFGPKASDHAVDVSMVKDTGDWHDFHTYQLDWTPEFMILSVDGKEINRIDIQDGSSFWKKFNLKGTNPWTKGSKMAPFDIPFYLILNVSVGGVGGMFNEGFTYAYPRPWKNSDRDPLKNFWEKRHLWLPSWHGEDVAMIVDYVEFRHL